MLNRTDDPMLERLARYLPELASEDNSHTAALLSNMISGRRLPHAVIIEGNDSLYNTRAAMLTARAYLCSCETPLSGECRSCHLFDTYDAHPDMYIIEGSGASGAISVDSVRNAKKRGGVIPTDAEGTVYLLERGDLMQKQAQNAILKLFEEPPQGLMLIMTVTSRMKLLETIRSRGTILHFEWPQNDRSDEKAQATEAAERLALTLTADTDADMLYELAEYCSGGAKSQDGQNPRRRLDDVLECMEEIFRQAALISAGAGGVFEREAEKSGREVRVSRAAKELAYVMSPERLTRLIRELEPLRRALKNNASMPLLTAAITERLRRAAGK